jgi:cholest-4-en-3-one 26-monooxygenase
MTTASSELSISRVFDPDVYGNGDPATFGLPLDLYDRMREDHPVLRLELNDPLLIDEVWVVSRWEDISAIDRDPATYAANINLPLIWKYAPIDPQAKPGLLVQDGEIHRDRRATLGKAFRPASMARLEERFRAYASEIVGAAVAKGRFDFVTDVAHALPVQALGDVLGVPEEDRPKFFGWVDTFASPNDPRVAPAFEKVGQALMELWQYGLEMVEFKKTHPSDDVMSRLAEIDMSDDEIQGNVALFASGAAETTRADLCHGMHELMRNPEQMGWLREHADDIPATVAQEFVRIGNAIISLVRTTTRDVELRGQEIKAGDRVAMLFAAGNFDGGAFADPRSFDLTRDPNPHLGFGRGPHSCLGKHVAALEIKILLEELLQRTKEIRPAGDIDYVRDNYARGVYSLPVTVTPA